VKLICDNYESIITDIGDVIVKENENISVIFLKKFQGKTQVIEYMYFSKTTDKFISMYCQ
jgi:hypothetical protein